MLSSELDLECSSLKWFFEPGGVGPRGMGGIWSKGKGMAYKVVLIKSSIESTKMLFQFLVHLMRVALLLGSAEAIGSCPSNLAYEHVMW
jgi:hypothetical protein